VVDDSHFARRIIKHLLEGVRDIAVIGEAEDGEEGLAKALELLPDVITLDLDMPKLDGVGMLQCLRRESEIPVVFVTGLPNLTEQLTQWATGLGAVEVVVKTFSDRPLDLSVFGSELELKIRKVTDQAMKSI